MGTVRHRDPSYAGWRRKRLSKRGNFQRGVQGNTSVVNPRIGARFEDTWRRMVMLDDVPTNLRYLLFDFRDTRWSSTQLSERYRDILLGFVR